MVEQRRTLTLVAAIAAVGISALLLVRTFRSGATGTLPPSPPEGEVAISIPLFTMNVEPVFSTRVSAENADEVADRLLEILDVQIRADQGLSGMGSQMIVSLREAAKEQLAIYLSGSFDRHWQYLTRTRAAYPMIDDAGTEPDAREAALTKLRSFWASMLEGWALHPVAPEDARIRTRYIRGKRTSKADDGYVRSLLVSPDRWPRISADPEVNGFTIVEVAWPVFYSVQTYMQPAYLGLWFVWDVQDKDWKIHQIRVYSVTRGAGFVGPIY